MNLSHGQLQLVAENKKIRTELSFAFSQMQKKHLDLLDQKFVEKCNTNIDTEYLKTLNAEKPFTKQELSEDTFKIIDILFSETKF